MHRKAFTLVELLVVISIIGLLSTIAIVSLSTARRTSRNTKRNADIKQLVTAFSLGLDANGAYPSTGGDVWKCISTACSGPIMNYTSSGTVDAFFQPFMPNKPADPNDGNARGNIGYVYNGASGATGNLPAFVYLLEPPATCSVGVAYLTTATYVECLVTLN
jgi:prepilin-type N-terminal cleavage/methylation domain-containing protein